MVWHQPVLETETRPRQHLERACQADQRFFFPFGHAHEPGVLRPRQPARGFELRLELHSATAPSEAQLQRQEAHVAARLILGSNRQDAPPARIGTEYNVQPPPGQEIARVRVRRLDAIPARLKLFERLGRIDEINSHESLARTFMKRRQIGLRLHRAPRPPDSTVDSDGRSAGTAIASKESSGIQREAVPKELRPAAPMEVDAAGCTSLGSDR